MDFVNMKILNQYQLTQAAQMLTDELPLGWPTLSEALREVSEQLNGDPEAVFMAAVDGGDVIGWCGILPHYDGRVFELHPLVVRHDRQREGIGAALIKAIEKAALDKGGLTLWAGADDEKPGGETSLANKDLYDDLPRQLKEFDPGKHQAAFYIKQGFKIIGVMPDANGEGKPDIFLAKRLR